MDLQAIRTKLAGKTGRKYWRSMEELADSEEFREALYREFPEGACEPDDSVSRRNFLKLMGASLALAGATGGCWKQPEEKIVPYVQQPELIVPGRPLYYATAFAFSGYGIGAIVESHMGRPTKVEGNPDHPASLGATNAYMQASILSLYDPDRSQTVNRGPDVSTW
jgi:molybdopterin-containing oxidoreductase family iron-sulfur binding subunit